jgi:tape measure domain-containing protein
MANETQDVELRIRATNYTKKTTTEAVAALKELTKAEEAQIEASKKGAASAADLEKGYTKIENAVKALLGQQSLIKLFQAQTASLDELNAKLAAARKAQQDYANSLDPAAKRTATQEATLRKLGRAVESVEKQMGRAEAKVASTSARLAEFGINSGNLADKQREIVNAVTTANAALERQDNAIANADGFAARAQLQERLLRQRHEQVRADVAFEQAQRRVIATLEQERQAQAALMAERQHNADIIFSNAQREQAERINRTTAALNLQRQALRDAADAAERFARNAATIARGAPVAQPTVASRVADIQRPNEAALRSTQALERAIGDLETRVASINGPVRNYRDTLRSAEQAQAALSNMAGLLDSYQRQIAAVRAARQEYVQARAAVNALVAEMRSGAAGEDVTTRLARAQSTLERAANGLGNVTTAARTTQAALRNAGVNTSDLAAAEAQLVAQAGRATTAMNGLTDAYRRNGAAADNAGRSIFNWFGGGDGARTTLSYTQRLRGEVLSLAAGFVGLNAAIALAKKTIDAYNQTQQTMNRLIAASNGDVKTAREEYAFLQEASDRIGVSFTKVAPAYAKLAIAAKQAGQTTQQVRYIFEGFALASSRLGLTAEQSERVFKALEQMFNKGKVSAEELSQQLGDSLPAALNLFAKASNLSSQEFIKRMEQGAIGPELIVKVSQELQKTYGAIGSGAENLSQAQARFENATNRFLNNVAQGGFVDAYQKLLNRLTDFMNNGSADRLAQALSKGFVLVIDIIETVVENLDLLKIALQAVIAVKFIGWLAQLPMLIRAVYTEMVLLNGIFAAGGFVNAARVVQGITAAMGAAGLTGVAARLGPALGLVANGLALIARWLPVIGAAVVAYQVTTAIVDKLDDNVRKNITNLQIATEKATAEAEKASADLAKKRGTAEEKAAQERYDKLRAQAVAAIKAQQKAELDAREDNVDLTKVQEAAKARRDLAAAARGPTEFPGMTDSGPRELKNLKDELDKEAKKTERAAQNERLKAAKGDLAARLDLIDQEYDERREKARATFKDEAQLAEALAAINKASLAKQAVERAKYNNEQSKKGEAAGEKRKQLEQDINAAILSMSNELEKQLAEQDVLKPFDERLAARKATVQKSFDEIEKRIRRLAALDPKAAREDQAQVDALKAQAVAIADVTGKREEANRLTEEFVKKQRILQTNIGAIQQQIEDGQITLEDGNARINEQLAQFGPGIADAGNAALRFATEFRNILDPVRFAEVVATIQSGLAKSDVDVQTAQNNVLTAQRMLNDMLAQEQREREIIQLQRQMGVITAQQEVDQLNASQQKYAGSILALATQLQNFVKIARESNAMSGDKLAELDAMAQRITISVQNARANFSELDKTIADSVVNNGVQAFDSLAQSMAKVITGQASLADGFRGAAQAAGQFFAQLLKDLALAIIRTQILKALQAFGGAASSVGAAAGSALSASGNHNGGIVGSNRTFTRKVDPIIFAGAQRFHNGGLPGLKADEVPTILQKGEEVLRKNDPRNVLNGGGNGGGDAPGFRVVLVDDRAKVPEAMASAEGDKVIVQSVKRNAATIRQLLK